MRYEEERLAAAVEELKALSATLTERDALAGLATIISGFETMRPYVSVGLKVCAPHETLQAINQLRDSGVLTPRLWHTLMNAVELARKRDVASASPAEPAVKKPCRRVTSGPFGRSLTPRVSSRNRFA